MSNFSNIKLAIVGAGHWGKNHVKTANNLLKPEQITVCDFSEKVREVVAKINPDINFTIDFNSILNNKEINSVIIATPAETHFEIAKKCLETGRNVLVEKPIVLVLGEAEELLLLSERSVDPDSSGSRRLKLMVGHVLLYHPAVQKLKSEIEAGSIGKLQYIYSNRLNLGAIRCEENILWSFAPHDISVIQYLIGETPIEVSAHGADIIQNGIEDTTITYLKYPSGVNAHIFVSWLHPFKEQRMVVVGDKGMIVFEDSLITEKLKLYKKGFEHKNGAIEKFDSDYEILDFEEKMPLSEEHIHFYESIINGTQPRTDGQHALEVLKILEEATKKLKEGMNGCMDE
ncbi:MAG: Gfo/Idh/MocA family oxidoreductase [Bacteroidetes bacterium]|nr:Gfo/Idh/MocA family oxidoreductase [Bacteroidota bacterium]